MNKKILGSIVAMVATLALVAGGTFAKWSDFDTIDGAIGADVLNIILNGGGAVASFDQVQMAPGINVERNFYIASRNGEAVPNANLTLTLVDLLGTENGCDGNSEDPDQQSQYTSSCDSTDLAYDAAGQFTDQAQIYYSSSDPVATGTDCSSVPKTNRVAGLPGSNGGVFKLDVAHNVAVDLLGAGNALGPDEGVCLFVDIRLPSSVDNSAQGDSATFDLRFDLTQV